MKILITGGTGFLGSHLVDYYQKKGDLVRILGRSPDRGEYWASRGVQYFQGDIRDRNFVDSCCEGQDFVIHAAALSTLWGKYSDFLGVNVEGTENLVNACIRQQVTKLVHISSPSIYFDSKDRLSIKEDDPLPKRFINDYAATKKVAEDIVDAGAADGLRTITLRPRAIFGERDTAIMPRILRLARRGFFPSFSSKDVLTNMTYVGNVVHAVDLALHAERRLDGEKYNITNDLDVPLRHFLDGIFGKMGFSVKKKRVPYVVAFGLACTFEFLFKRLRISKEPILTRYSVGLLSRNVTLDTTKAKRDLGYSPIYSLEAGVERYVNWWLQPASK